MGNHIQFSYRESTSLFGLIIFSGCEARLFFVQSLRVSPTTSPHSISFSNQLENGADEMLIKSFNLFQFLMHDLIISELCLFRFALSTFGLLLFLLDTDV